MNSFIKRNHRIKDSYLLHTCAHECRTCVNYDRSISASPCNICYHERNLPCYEGDCKLTPNTTAWIVVIVLCLLGACMVTP